MCLWEEYGKRQTRPIDQKIHSKKEDETGMMTAEIHHNNEPYKVNIKHFDPTPTAHGFWCLTFSAEGNTVNIFIQESLYGQFLNSVASKIIGRCHVCDGLIDPDEQSVDCKHCGIETHLECVRRIPKASAEDPQEFICYNCLDAELTREMESEE